VTFGAAVEQLAAKTTTAMNAANRNAFRLMRDPPLGGPAPKRSPGCV
jgi:hypothetical protein